MRKRILIENNLVEIPEGKNSKFLSECLGTVCANIAYYGFIPSKESFQALSKLNEKALEEWWSVNEKILKKITGEDKKMADFVVYKNFPKEVLEKSEAQYWIAQILMYIGLPNEYFTQEEEKREPMFDKIQLKVLHLANDNSLQKILENLLSLPARWSDKQFDNIRFLFLEEKMIADLGLIPFKENLVNLATLLINEEIHIKLTSATDILRLVVGMSNGDVSLRTNSKIKSFSRKERLKFIDLLDKSSNLEEDFARNKEVWKRIMHLLHPNDYIKRFKRVSDAYQMLYTDDLRTFNGKVEKYISNKNKKVLDLLKTRPGDFARRLNKMVGLFGMDAAKAFVSVLEKLTVYQLLKIDKYLEFVNVKFYRTIAPKGNWTKLKILDNKERMSFEVKDFLKFEISLAIEKKLNDKLNSSINLCGETRRIKLQDNNSTLMPYGRGTSFPIPENIKFIRTASYWQKKSEFGSTWFDNGWNFFDINWNPVGVCCWTDVNYNSGAAIFSGDPTNSKEMKGRACQMIDLYLDKLEKAGVVYAVWNILCYSNICFNKADEVYAALQWGEEPQKGNLFEPNRCQLSFPLKGDNFTKYIAYINISKRELVYMDANLSGSVRTARANMGTLAKRMPAFQEYLDTIPSIYDLFKYSDKSKDGIVVAFDDGNYELKDGQLAYVFKPVKEENSFTPLQISDLLKK